MSIMDTNSNDSSSAPNKETQSGSTIHPDPASNVAAPQPQPQPSSTEQVVTPTKPVNTPQTPTATTPPVTQTPQKVTEPAVTAQQPQVAAIQPEPTITPAQHGVPRMPEKPTDKKKSILFVVLAALFAVSTALAIFFGLDSRSARSEISELQAKVADLDKNEHELPEGLIKVTECIPNMGFHYIDPNNDPRLGPIYLVSNDGKLIGYEFMFDASMMTFIPNQEIALEVLLTDGPIDLHDWQYNSIEFSRSPEGHPGYEQDHFDVHLYTVTSEVQAQACG